MRRGDHHTTNRMFRARIYAQGFTLLAVVAGSMYYKQDREKRKEFDGAVAERKAKEKAEAWIRELEARDLEDKEMKAMRGAAREEAIRRRDGVGQARTVVEIGEVKGDGGVVEIGEARGEGRITDAVRELVQGKK
jgi:crotonobetainyl-CoA:carnitine CoA-transferase CaiB-like acyl-CoA transferase